MNLLIAPAPFKESMRAVDVANCLEGVFRSKNISAICQPISDGGDGFLDVFMNEKRLEVDTVDCLHRPIKAHYVLLSPEVAIIEMAQATGLVMVKESDRNPSCSSSLGTGVLIMDAISRGCSTIIIGLGGSATNDGGLGIFRAVGGRVFNEMNREVVFLNDITPASRLDWTGIPSSLPRIVAATDVQNILLGPQGATFVYGPQKGISSDALAGTDEKMCVWADLVEQKKSRKYRDIPGAGAAGGVGFGLLSIGDAAIKSGFDIVARHTQLESLVSNAGLVITGEGRMDIQSAFGKAPHRLMEMCNRKGVPIIALVGDVSSRGNYSGFDKIYSLSTMAGSSVEAMKNPSFWIEQAADQIAENYLGT